MTQIVNDLLGAHVSTSGGCSSAPVRAAEIGSRWTQIFTKQPQRWAEPEFGAAEGEAYRAACAEHGIIGTTVHASYLINAASPDETLYERSVRSLAAEYRRSAAIGAAHVVVHPGSATDGDRAAGLVRNADAVVRILRETEGETVLCLEVTTGKGNVLGSTLEELRFMLDRIEETGGDGIRARAACCLDTCHLYAAGYDLRDGYDDVMAEVERVLGLDEVKVWHLNDSQGALGSTTDRHADIGEGQIGEEGFRRLMRDSRLAGVPMLLETPKGDDPVASDRRNLERLRRLRG
jgi:deoxyribonuclease IV